MRKISYRHKKIAAEKDSKDLNGVYFRAVREDAEKDLPESPLGEQEDRRSYFQRLNNHIESNKEVYDNLPEPRKPPFGRDAIIFVGTIPESELEPLQKGDRLNFVKWIASNYSGFSELLTLDNISKIRSLIEVSPDYNFSTINEYSPNHFMQALAELESNVSVKSAPSEESVLEKLNIDPELLGNTDNVFSKENRPNISDFLSDREILMLRTGAALTGKENSLDLILDFLFSEDSDIEIEKPGDVEALFPFSFDSREEIKTVFNALDEKQDEWHRAMSSEAGQASSSSGAYGYGYLTNIVVHNFGDGWRLVYLPGQGDPEMVPWSENNAYSHDRIQEGDNNSLCLGSGSKLYNDNNHGFIYSLRDPSNKPIATMRTKLNLREKADLSEEYFSIEEIREKYNGSLGIESSMYLRNFFESRNAYSGYYSRYLKDTSEYSLLGSINAVTDKERENKRGLSDNVKDIFDWIYFLNKKRSNKKESQKYAAYFKYYDELIGIRNDLYNDDSGLFFNGSSVVNDESRVTKYIYKILTKIKDSNSAAFTANDFKERLFGIGIDHEDLKKFYSRIFPKIPSGKDALRIISKESPKIVYNGVNRSYYSLHNFLGEYGPIAAKTLLSGGDNYLDAFFAPLTRQYSTVFFKRHKDFAEEYRQQNVIDYLEALYLKNKESFIDGKFYLYYYGNNPEINDQKKNILSNDLKEHLEKIKKNNESKPKPSLFSHKILEFIENNGEYFIQKDLIDKELAYDIAKYFEEYIDANDAPNQEYLMASALTRYFIFKKLSQSNDNNFAHGDRGIIRRVIHYKLKSLSIYSSVISSSNVIADLIESNFISFTSPKLIDLTLKDVFESKIDDLSSDTKKIDNIYSLTAINLILKKLSNNFNINFNDLIQRTEISEDKILSTFSSSPQLFFESGIGDIPKYSNLKNILIMKQLDSMFDLGEYDTSYGLSSNSSTLANILKQTQNDNAVLNKIKEKIDSIIYENIESATVSTSDDAYETRNQAAKLILTIKLLYMVFEKIKEIKLLSAYRRDILNRLKNQTQKLSDYVKEVPKIFYDHKIYEIPNISIDRREVALLYINQVLERSHDITEDAKGVLLTDLGLNKSAKSLSNFFIKNGFLDELKSLAKLFVN